MKQELVLSFCLIIILSLFFSDEDLAEASTSFTESDNKPRARQSKARKAKEQRPISPIRCC